MVVVVGNLSRSSCGCRLLSRSSCSSRVVVVVVVVGLFDADHFNHVVIINFQL